MYKKVKSDHRSKFLFKQLERMYKWEKNANYASNNRMYIKCDKVRIKSLRIVLDLHDVIADSRKVVVFECEIPLFYLKLENRRGMI